MEQGTMRFEPTWESLQQYQCPEWFRDAKFGIWAHWGPQAVPEVGDWYARNMYIQGNSQYEHHVKTYGHPSKVGYKDIVKRWKAERFEPERLMQLYKRAGARYFVAMGVHHDNFDCWNSQHHRWNAVKMGPGKDIVGLWSQAARKHGLRFGVSEHLERSYCWFNTNKGSDTTGPLAGVAYDGTNPDYADFYFPPHDDAELCYPKNPPEWWQTQWLARITDLLDQYQPDLLYTDGGIPFGSTGRELVARFYNRNMQWHAGMLEAVYNLKDARKLVKYGPHGEYREGVGVLDVERGVVDGISPEPWQTDTSIGDWYYNRTWQFRPVNWTIHMLLDIVSKNGNLLLNIVQRPDGTLDEEVERMLAELADWITVNGEGIYGTRPWRVYGEGPTTPKAGLFAEDDLQYTSSDFRFTQKDDTVYAYCLAVPEKEMSIQSMGRRSGVQVKAVELLGSAEQPVWRQGEEALEIALPSIMPSRHAIGLKIKK